MSIVSIARLSSFFSHLLEGGGDSMMQQGNWQQPNCHQGNMMGGNQVRPVVCPTQYRCHDKFVPREVPFIHPIVNVNRVHTVEIPRHYFTETTQNVMGQTLPARPGMGPGMGPGYGPGMGPGMGGYGPQVGGIGNRPGCGHRPGCGCGNRRGW